jgi:hypothetical protein
LPQDRFQLVRFDQERQLLLEARTRHPAIIRTSTGSDVHPSGFFAAGFVFRFGSEFEFGVRVRSSSSEFEFGVLVPSSGSEF